MRTMSRVVGVTSDVAQGGVWITPDLKIFIIIISEPMTALKMFFCSFSWGLVLGCHAKADAAALIVSVVITANSLG